MAVAFRLARAASGCALAAALLSSAERWARTAALMGPDLLRIRAVNVLSAFMGWVMELEEGGMLRGGAALVELAGPARGLLDGLIGWDGEGAPPDAVIACAQSAIPLFGFAQDRQGSFRATELPTFPGAEPADDDLDRLKDDQLVDDVGELRLLLRRLATVTGARYVALFDRSGCVVHSTREGAEPGSGEASETLVSLAQAPGLGLALTHIDLFSSVHCGDAVIVLRLAGAHATLVAELGAKGDATRLRAAELHFLLNALIEARGARVGQLCIATLVPGRDGADDPFR